MRGPKLKFGAWDSELLLCGLMVILCMDVKPGMEVACLTDVGRLRENNEDSCLYWEPQDKAEFLRKGRLAVIADGMGGYEGGQEASRLAVETVREIYENAFENGPQATLVKAFASAHKRIQSYAETHPELRGMGTTCTALVIRGYELHFAHVGDSRLYLIRGTVLSRLTRDHSYVGRLVENGIVRAEDAESHPQRHILTAALGSGNEVAADVSQQPVPLRASDTLVLCTDGLWGVVNEREIVIAVNEFDPEECCRALVNKALERGGPDNITVQLIRVGAETD